MFPNNVHQFERVARIVVGAGLLSQAFTGYESPWFFLGAIPLLTGIVGTCPIYTVFGFSTCSLGKK